MILSIILFIIIIILGFFFKKALDRISYYEELYTDLDSVVNESSEKLKLIDDSGHFESDDEIGFIFKEIKQIQKTISSLFDSDEGEKDIGEETTQAQKKG
tara:strand:+ start:278 stop:577 length:300 start_codon:yes stop_codon:yes gene_type:complete